MPIELNKIIVGGPLFSNHPVLPLGLLPLGPLLVGPQPVGQHPLWLFDLYPVEAEILVY